MQNPAQTQKMLRINVATWAYAYEIANDPLVDNGTYDHYAKQIDSSIETGHAILDTFFKNHYRPYSGGWIHHHPDLQGIRARYYRLAMIRDARLTNKTDKAISRLTWAMAERGTSDGH